MLQPDLRDQRRDWWVAGLIAVVLHVVILGALLSGMKSNPQGVEAMADVPALPGAMRGDSLPISGLAPPPDPRQVRRFQCEYVMRGPDLRARLQAGEPRSAAGLGCPNELTLVAPIDQETLEIQYDERGEIVAVAGDTDFQGEQSRAVISSWRLAVPRPGMVWPATPIASAVSSPPTTGPFLNSQMAGYAAPHLRGRRRGSRTDRRCRKSDSRANAA